MIPVNNSGVYFCLSKLIAGEQVRRSGATTPPILKNSAVFMMKLMEKHLHSRDLFVNLRPLFCFLHLSVE